MGRLGMHQMLGGRVTLQELRLIVEATKDEPEDTEVVIPSKFYSSPNGHSRMGYSICAMGGCSWSEKPEAFHHRVLLLSLYGGSYD